MLNVPMMSGLNYMYIVLQEMVMSPCLLLYMEQALEPIPISLTSKKGKKC